LAVYPVVIVTITALLRPCMRSGGTRSTAAVRASIFCAPPFSLLIATVSGLRRPQHGHPSSSGCRCRLVHPAHRRWAHQASSWWRPPSLAGARALIYIDTGISGGRHRQPPLHSGQAYRWRPGAVRRVAHVEGVPDEDLTVRRSRQGPRPPSWGCSPCSWGRPWTATAMLRPPPRPRCASWPAALYYRRTFVLIQWPTPRVRGHRVTAPALAGTRIAARGGGGVGGGGGGPAEAPSGWGRSYTGMRVDPDR